MSNREKSIRRVNEALPGTNLFGKAQANLTYEEVRYLYNVAEGHDISAAHFASAKDMAIDAHMTGFVRVYKYEDNLLAGDIVAPVVPVRSRVGTYKTRDQSAMNVFISDQGAQGADTNEIGFEVGEGTYTTENRKLKIFVSDDEIAERGALDPMKEATLLLKHGMDLRQEIRIRNLAEATSNGATIGTDWDTSTAVHTDINTHVIAFEAENGQPPTHIQFNSDVAGEIMANVLLGSGLFLTAPAPPDPLRIPGMHGWQNFPSKGWGMNVVITNARYNSADDIKATPVATYVWPDACFMYRVDRMQRSGGWAMQPEFLAATIVRWRDEDRGGWYLKILRKRDEVEVKAGAVRELADVT